MKSFRILVVLLIAFLLPIRGAVAATMLCSDPGEAAQLAAMHGDHAMHADHDDAGPDHHDDGGHTSSCHLCASGCHAVALASVSPSVDGPVLTALVKFPTLSAPVPAFHSDGQERPPRTI